MKMAGGIVTWLRRVYDRLVASLVLAALLSSLVMLALNAKLLQSRQAEFDRWLEGLPITHEQAQPADRSTYDRAILLLKEPPQIDGWTQRLMIPEMRIACFNCQRPIPYAAEICPYCKAAKEASAAIPEWEKLYGALAKDKPGEDPDKDGFTNLEERDGNTSPIDPNDHPSYLLKLTVARITPIPFDLVFQAASKVSGGALLFQINDKTKNQTFWRKMGEEIACGTDRFKLIDYDEKSGGGLLTLQKGGRRISLKQGMPYIEKEFEAELAFAVDGSKYTVRSDARFTIRDAAFKVKSIDMAGTRVLITDLSSKKDFWVGSVATGARSTQD